MPDFTALVAKARALATSYPLYACLAIGFVFGALVF